MERERETERERERERGREREREREREGERETEREREKERERDRERGRDREREMFYLMTHSTHFIYGYMASDIWLRTILIVRKETRCRHIGYSYRLTARVLFFYMHHPTDRITHTTAFVTPVVEHWLEREIAQWVHPKKDRSDDPSHHERTLLPRIKQY